MEQIKNTEKKPIKPGDYIIYSDNRDNYAGTVVKVNDDKNTATIKVVLTIRDEHVFTELEVPLDKVRIRELI